MRKLWVLLALMCAAVSGTAAAPVQYGAVGNMYGAWKGYFGTVKNYGSLAIPETLDCKVLFISSVGQKKARFSEKEAKTLYDFCSNGGILVMDYSANNRFGDGKPFSLRSDVLGGSRYAYGNWTSNGTPLAEEIFGKDAKVLTGMKFRGPALGNTLNVKVLQLSGKTVLWGVNRIGKGACIYIALPVYDKKNAPVFALLKELLVKMENQAFLDKYFPEPKANDAAVVNGKKFHLAIAGSATPAAAKFLEGKLAAITGKSDFSTSGNFPGTIKIYVGITPEVQKLKLDFKTLHHYGYYMIKKGDMIVLAGKNAKANNYAVNDFLKRFAGYRNFGSGALFEVLPARASLELPAEFSFREEPDIPSYCVAWAGNEPFARSGRVIAMNTHSMDKFIPPAMYAAKHPEWYSEVEGVRVFKVKKRPHWQPCLNNPELGRLALEYADRYFKKSPHSLTLPFGVNDGAGDCHCSYCVALDKKYGNRYAVLYNIAAKAIKKKYPGKLIGFIAYGQAKKVPRNIKMEDNILVEVCNIGNTNSYVDYAKWKAVGIKHFGLYDYFYPFGGGGYITHRYYPRYVTEIWRREFKKFPVKSMWLEYYPRTLIFDAPRQYVLDEYAWNNDVDVEALLKDYFTSMYGKGGAAVQKFFDLQEKILYRRKNGTMWSDAGVKQFRVYTAADLEKLNALLAEAEKYFQNNDLYAKRFRAVKKAWELSQLYIKADLCIREINSGKNLLDSIRRGYETVAKLNSFTLTREEERSVFVGKGSLNGVRSALTRIKPDVLLDTAADRQLEKLTARLLKEKSKAAVAAQYRAEAEKSTDTAFRRIILTQVWQLEKRGRNILSNPGFELSKGKKVKSNNPSDWTGFRGVPGWYTWRFPDSAVDFLRVSDDVHSGKFAAAIGRNQVNGGICTSVPLEPGCRYRVSCYVKRNDNNKGGKLGGFGIRLVGPGGKWLDSGSAIGVSLDERCIGKWQKYEVAFTAPDMPASALFVFSAPVQGSASRVIFDDVVFEKIYDPMDMKNVKKFTGDPQVDEAMRWGAPLFKKLTGAEIVPVKWQLNTKGAFFCRVEGKKLFVFGDAEGVRCGIYRVLQKLGVHWFSPREEMIIPKKAAMPFAKLNRFAETPAFPYRSLHICGSKHHYDETAARWMSFNCMNGKLTHLPEDDIIGGELKKLGLAPDTTVHAYDLMIPADKYYKTNPEFFALVGNKRITGGGQLCVSNEKMREAFVKELYALIKAKPHIGVYGICPNDGYGWCECEKCKAMDSPADRKKKTVNRRVALFVADICARIHKIDPNIKLGHYSYSIFSDFAEYLPSVPDNLVISFTEFRCFRHSMDDPKCPTNSVLWKRMKHLLTKTGALYIYDYYQHNWGGMPAACFKTIKGDFKAWKKNKVHGFLSEVSAASSASWDSHGRLYYLAAKLLWNDGQDEQKLIAELCSISYGKGAKYMLQYFQELQNALYSTDRCFLKNPEDFEFVFPEKTMVKCGELLDKALAAEGKNNPRLNREKAMYDSWVYSIRERKKYQTPMEIQAYDMADFTGEFKPQPLHFVKRTDQLPAARAKAEAAVYESDTKIGFRLKMTVKDITKLKKVRSVFGSENIEIFVADGKAPKVTYHFIFSFDGRVSAAKSESTTWNWAWPHSTKFKTTQGKDYWTLDVEMEKKEMNVGKKGFGFTLIYNINDGKWGIVGTPAGGAYFKTDRYIRTK